MLDVLAFPSPGQGYCPLETLYLSAGIFPKAEVVWSGVSAFPFISEPARKTAPIGPLVTPQWQDHIP